MTISTNLHCQLIQAGEIQAIIGDGSRDGVGGTQYAGVWSLTSQRRVHNAFGNSYAGLLPSEIRGNGPVLEFDPGNPRAATLTRPASPLRASHCVARYEVRAPYYLDHTLTIEDQQRLPAYTPPSDYREIGWCNYMNSPSDSKLRFLSGGDWFDYMSPKHGQGSYIFPSYVPDAELETLPAQTFDRGYPHPFHVDPISRRFDQPFYYGLIEGMLFLLVFDRPRELRFYLSPSGGGMSILPGKTCPAWDFCWVVKQPGDRALPKQSFRVRVVYKRFVSNQDVLDEVKRAQDELGFEKV